MAAATASRTSALAVAGVSSARRSKAFSMISRRLSIPIFYLVVAAASFALRHAIPVQAEAGAIHDDALFVRLATHVAAGDWLGPYDQLTLAKGAGYPVFIALAWLAGIPLKLA